MKRVIVTGGSGKIGGFVLSELLDHGYELLNLDLRPAGESRCRTLLTDLTDAGQAFSALAAYTGLDELQPSLKAQPADAIVHLAAIPRILLVPDTEVFRINTVATYNVLEIASKLGIPKVVFASSEAAYGIDFADSHRDPAYFPIDEEHPVIPMDTYGLSKVCNERTAQAFQLRTGKDVYGLRIGDVMAARDYDKFPEWTTRPQIREREAWAYVDARDVAQVVRLAVETDGLGFEVFNVAAGESASVEPIRSLVQRFYPNVPIREPLEEFGSLLSNRKAVSLLGFKQAYRWREQPASGP
ncbi:MAG: NAD(P)-dependent oxidoreductase [Candidatus Dormiibacterota bacterium]